MILLRGLFAALSSPETFQTGAAQSRNIAVQQDETNVLDEKLGACRVSGHAVMPFLAWK